MRSLVLIALAVGAFAAAPSLQSPPAEPLTVEQEESLSLAWCEAGTMYEAAWALDDETTARAAREVQDRVEAILGKDGVYIIRRYIPAFHNGQRMYRSTGAAPRPA